MQYFSNQDPFYKSNENLTKIEKLVFTKGFFLVFPVFSRREIGDSKPGKCATLIQTFRTILAKKGRMYFFLFFGYFFVNFFQRYLYVRTFRTILAKKGTNEFFSYFLAIFCEFLSTLSLCANVLYNFGEKRNECIFPIFYQFFMNFFQRYL